jgi:phosphoribosylaminoimidazole-succinocarboxamide synthase
MKKELLYEGKAKRIWSTDEHNLVVQEFKDDATAFNGLKKDQIKNKGVLNTGISSAIFEYLIAHNIPTHFEKMLSENEMLVKRVDIIKVEVVVRNIAAGSLVKKFGFTEGEELKFPLVEYYLKSDELGDPLFSLEHILTLELATKDEIEKIHAMALKINELMQKFWYDRGIDLIDFKLEFGRDSKGEIILADEISPDTCRLWDLHTGEKMDKDRFRFDMGKVEEAYEEISRRVKIHN